MNVVLVTEAGMQKYRKHTLCGNTVHSLPYMTMHTINTHNAELIKGSLPDLTVIHKVILFLFSPSHCHAHKFGGRAVIAKV